MPAFPGTAGGAAGDYYERRTVGEKLHMMFARSILARGRGGEGDACYGPCCGMLAAIRDAMMMELQSACLSRRPQLAFPASILTRLLSRSRHFPSPLSTRPVLSPLNGSKNPGSGEPRCKRTERLDVNVIRLGFRHRSDTPVTQMTVNFASGVNSAPHSFPLKPETRFCDKVINRESGGGAHSY